VLAWRRTLLALAVGWLVAVRVLPPVLGPWSLAIGSAGVLAVALLWPAMVRRSRALLTALRSDSGPLPDGWALLGLALLVAVGAAIALLWTVARSG
jgi:hypothetical protein